MTTPAPDAEVWHNTETAPPRTGRERRYDVAAEAVYVLGWEAFPLLARLGGALRDATDEEPACVQIGDEGDGYAWAALSVGGVMSDTDVASDFDAADGSAAGLPHGPRGALARLGAMLLEDARGHPEFEVRKAAADLRRAMKGAQNP